MELRIVNPQPEYGPPAFVEPPHKGYLHIGAAVAPPTGPPFVRSDRRRTALLARLRPLAAELRRLPAVEAVTVYRAVLVPPVGRHAARFDVAVLIETATPEVLDEVRAAPPYTQLLDALSAAASDVMVQPARCVRSLGEVDKGRQGLFLFNHFVADDPEVAVRLWEHLAGWYVTETGLDNSTLLAPLDDGGSAGRYALVNHARWDKSLLRLAAEQFGKRSFVSHVRANLRANNVVAVPVLYRLAES